MIRGMSFLVFLVIGVFAVLEFSAFKYIETAKTQAEVRVFLTGDADIDYLKKEIEKEKGVEGDEFLSEEYALEEFKKEFKISNLVINPLPASFRVVLNPKYKTPEYLSSFSARVKRLDGVDNVVYGKEYIQTLCTVSQYFKWLCCGACGLLFFLLLFTIITSLNHRLWVMKNEIAVLHSFGISKLRLKLRLGSRVAIENLVLSCIAVGLVYGSAYIIFTQAKPNLNFLFTQAKACGYFMFGFVGGCALLTFIISLMKRL